jgi:hypothetical protein
MERTRVEHGNCEFNVAEMPRALGHVLATCCTLVCAVDAAQLRVIQTPLAWPHALFVHCLGVLDVANTHIFCFFRREETELNLLDGLERRLRVGEAWCCSHGYGWFWVPARLALDIIQAVVFFIKYACRRGSHVCTALHNTRSLLRSLCWSFAAAYVRPYSTAQSA